MTTPRAISRLVDSSAAHNTINQPPPVPIFLQKSPDAPSGDTRGIAGVDFQVLINGAVVQSGTTAADGKIDVRVPPGGSSTLQLMVAGTAVAQYEVSVDSSALDAVSTVRGQQERLRMLGYQIGPDGPDGNGVGASGDNTITAKFERSIIDFQADQGLFPDAKVGPITQPRITQRAGA
jgi:hypothetical protein